MNPIRDEKRTGWEEIKRVMAEWGKEVVEDAWDDSVGCWRGIPDGFNT